MDSFKEREAQAETKFAHDAELHFKVTSHRNKLFAAWAADQLGDGAPPDYAVSLLDFAFGREDADLIDKVRKDLHDHGVAVADVKVNRAFHLCEDQSQVEVMTHID
jgi:hypothetical protein